MNVESQRWKQQYEAERTRLLEALGRLGEGGIVESIQHIGGTSVPGLYGSTCVDIGLALWPFPLEAGPMSRLEALGYQLESDYEGPPEQHFRHASQALQLHIIESGRPAWYDLLLVRDYLNHDSAARERFSFQKRAGVAGKSQLFAELLPAARQWWIGHHRFSPVAAAANELREAPFPWYVSGGWALDLFLGQVSRVHHDVDVVVPRSAQMELRRHLLERDWKLVTPLEKRPEPWPPHMRLELPRHQVHAHRGDEFLDFLLTEMDGVWTYRREPAVIRSLERMAMRTESGIPYLAPELALLFKSKNTSDQERSKDAADFERALPHLDTERRAWLRWALIATAPEHPWIERLG